MSRGMSYVVSGRGEVWSGQVRVVRVVCRVDDGEVCFEKKLGERRRRVVSEDMGEWYRRNKLSRSIE